MNTHKVLLKLGFKSCVPHKMESSWDNNYKKVVVPDLTENKRVNGKYKEVKKIHPKNLKFYNQKYTNDVIIWVKATNNVISDIWLDNNTNDIDVVYDIHNTSKYRKNPIKSKSDIINLLPKNIKRNLIIDTLFK